MTQHSRTVALNGGGVGSLIVTAMLSEKSRLALLHLRGGRGRDELFYRAFLAQADHFEVPERLEVVAPRLTSSEPRVMEPEDKAPASLAVAELLSAAASEAVRLKAERLVWPVRAGEDFDAVAQVTEAVQLVQQLVELGHDHPLQIETPLLEMTLTEAIEAGHQMQAPWELARSCWSRKQTPCEKCEGCRKRREAFNELGLPDPQRKDAVGAR